MATVDRDLMKLFQEIEDYQSLTESLREQLDCAHKENSSLINDNNIAQRKITTLKQELSNNHNEYSRLESELYQAKQELEKLKKENLLYSKTNREIERKLREETQVFEKEKIIWQERESELIVQSKTLQETLNVLAQQSEQSLQKKDEILSTSHSINARELKNAQKQIKVLEHKNSDLEIELTKTKEESIESINRNKRHVRKIQELENEISQIKHMNQTLMEDNESYQLLLHEKTIKGDFMMNPILQLGDYNTKHTDKVEKVTDNISKDDDDKDSPKSRDSPKSEESLAKNKSISHTDLSAELNRAMVLSVALQGENVYKESDHTMTEKLLQDEIKSLRDANKSMKLYIQKILNRIMEAKGFEEILSSDWTADLNDGDGDKSGKKIERRKTLSEFHHHHSKSQPQNNHGIKVLTEEPEESLTTDNNQHKEPTLTKGLTESKRIQRSKSISHTKYNNITANNNTHFTSKHNKRFSFLDWVGGTNKETTSKKDDPYMKPIILLKENPKN